MNPRDRGQFCNRGDRFSTPGSFLWAAAAIALTMAGAQPASAFHQVCKIVDWVSSPVSDCQKRCDQTKLADWLNPGPTSQDGGSLVWDNINYPHNVTERPPKITSCKATASPEFPGACRITICGPVMDPTDLKRAGAKASRKVATPIPVRPIGPPQPGLLETDVDGMRQQGPAAIGSPVGGAAVGSPTYSRSVR